MGSFIIFPDENFIDLTIVQFGWEQCKPLHSYGPGVRNNYLFHFVFSGTGYVEFGGEKPIRYQLKPNSGFLICPGQVVTYCADKRDPWKYAWVEFSGIQANRFLSSAGLNAAHPIYIPASPEGAARVSNEIQSITMAPDASTMNLIGHLYLFFDALASTSENKRKVRNQSQESYYIREAMNYIERHYAEQINIDDIADFCGLSRTHFGRLFKKVTGETPQKYLIHFRMNQAIDLMRTTDWSLGEIALRVGYQNQLYFSKVFHRTFGMSPRSWRQNDLLSFENLKTKKGGKSE